MDDRIKTIESINRMDCCACGSCVAACPQKAIHMIMNNMGSYYPVVNHLCVQCGKCLDACPSSHMASKSSIMEGYAVVSKIEHEKCASGGAFYTLAARFIEINNGVVYGVVINESMDAVVARAENQTDIINMLGSKYVKSSIGDLFLTIRNDLISGRKVLFSGAPCQIAAVKAFLCKDYENLFTIDIVCHGMPGKGVFQSYIQWIKNSYGKSVSAYRFRTKTGYDRDGFIAEIFFDDDTSIKSIGKYDPYYGCFLDSSIFMECCYSCKYACPERVSDITIGDWNSRGDSRFYDWRAVSIALINTRKGLTLWTSTKHLFDISPISLLAEIKGNRQLNRPSDIALFKPDVLSQMMNGDFLSIKKKRIQSVSLMNRIIERTLMLVPFHFRKKCIHWVKDLCR